AFPHPPPPEARRRERERGREEGGRREHAAATGREEAEPEPSVRHAVVAAGSDAHAGAEEGGAVGDAADAARAAKTKTRCCRRRPQGRRHRHAGAPPLPPTPATARTTAPSCSREKTPPPSTKPNREPSLHSFNPTRPRALPAPRDLAIEPTNPRRTRTTSTTSTTRKRIRTILQFVSCRLGLGVQVRTCLTGCAASLKDACGEDRRWGFEGLATATQDFHLSCSS
ncbi:unnamed protein product, partial [Urochloa humidicola]